jgi:hypothetical protein
MTAPKKPLPNPGLDFTYANKNQPETPAQMRVTQECLWIPGQAGDDRN